MSTQAPESNDCRDPPVRSDGELRFRQLAESFSDAFMLRTVNPSEFLYVSPAYERIFERSVDSLYKNPSSFLDAVHPDDRERVEEQLTVQGPRPLLEMEYRIVRPDGTVRWIRAKRALVDGVGSAMRVAGTVEDITDHRTAEKARRETEQLFRLLVENVADYAIMMLDDQGVIVSWNAGAERITGYAGREIIGRHVSVFYSPNQVHAGHPEHALATAEATGRFEEEGLRIRKDGSTYLADVVIAPVLNPDGSLRGFAEVTRDVTAVREREAGLRTLMDANIVGVFVADSEFILDANDLFLGIAGYTRRDLSAGLQIRNLTPSNRLEAGAGVRAELLERGAFTPYESELNHKDGRRIPIVFGGALLRAEPVKCICFALDLSEAKRTESALKKSQAEAARANDAKTEFLSRMSHELRTPLNAILGFAQLLELGDTSGYQREYVENILKGGRHLLDLINEVLDISRIESGKLRLSLEPVSLPDVASEALDLIQPMASAGAVRIASLPTFAGAVHVHADRQRLLQVLLNVLSNAVKYNRPGGDVRIECEALDGKWVRLVVTDTGIGIAEHDVARLFTAFERLGAEDSVEGSGLGLALSRRLVEAMGGRIGLTSKADKGTSVWIELTALAPLSLDVPAAWEEDETSVKTPPAVASVLYVEDNIANVKLVEHIVSLRPGITLLSAMQGSVGLELAHEHRPSLILLDLNLPDIGGLEVLRRLRGDPATEGIPVVVVSADASPGQSQRLLAAGASGYLTKPYEIASLLELIDVHCESGDPPGPVPDPPGAKPPSVQGLSVDTILDASVIAGFRRLEERGGPSMVGQMIGSFLAETTVELPALAAAAAASDVEKVHELTHLLRGSTACYGAHRMTASCHKLQELIESGKLPEVQAGVRLLEAEFVEVRKALVAEFPSLGSNMARRDH
jgi:PAS domain S-box-containing protein